jgi:hypothetical protein
MSTAHRAHDRALREHFHVDPVQPKSMAHVAMLFAKGHYVKPDDEQWNRESEYYGDALNAFEFREHPADMAAYETAIKKLHAKYDAIMLRAKVKDAKDVLSEVESFRDADHKTFH